MPSPLRSFQSVPRIDDRSVRSSRYSRTGRTDLRPSRRYFTIPSRPTAKRRMDADSDLRRCARRTAPRPDGKDIGQLPSEANLEASLKRYSVVPCDTEIRINVTNFF